MSDTRTIAPANRFVVLKFGGTSVATAARWRAIHDISQARRRDGLQVVVVVSALSGVTNLLQASIDATSSAARQQALAEIKAKHEQLLDSLSLAMPDSVARQLAELAGLVEQAATGASNLAWQAQLMAQGELLSSQLGVALFRHWQTEADWLDSREVLLAIAEENQSDWGRWLSVNCHCQRQPALNQRLVAEAPIHIAPGFMARNADGQTVILGRGGSDTSAAYLGAVLGAERVEIWTDVAGMFSADPRQVPEARLLGELDFEEAQEITTTGAKVLHPRSINPVRETDTPLWIKDTNRPDLAGTVICAKTQERAPSIKAISQRKGVVLVSMETLGMWNQVGFLADVFAAFKQHGLSVDLIGSAETNVTVSLDPSENLVNSNVLEALCTDLAKVCRVKVIGPCAAITLVGRGMRAMLSKLSSVFGEIGSRRVHLISQSSNDLNLTFVVDESEAVGLLAHLHQSLVHAGVMRVDDPAVFGPSWSSLYRTEQRATPAWWHAKQSALLELAAGRSPRYVYDAETIRERAQALKAITSVDRWFYAQKANDHASVLKLIAESGLDIECVSPAELAQAQAAAPKAARLYTPNFASAAELRAACPQADEVSVDGLQALQLAPEAYAGRRVLLRLDLGVGRGHHDKVRTGGARSKFGIAVNELPAALKAAQAAGAIVYGLHAHLGSGILDLAHFREVYAQLASLAERIPSVAVLNIGGGLGVPYWPDEHPLDLVALAATLAEVKAAYPQFELWMEPGRFLVAEAGVLLARVTQIKHKQGVQFVGVDAGMHVLARPALYEAYHGIWNLSKAGQPADTLVTVVGQICESGDVLGRDRRIAAPEVGDVLLLSHAGAYGAVMASHYNRRPAADEVML